MIKIIKYQKKFTEPFTKLYRRLYEYEYRFTDNSESELLDFIDLRDIKISFPSPATLNMSNLTDQIQVVDGNAEFIASTLIPPLPDGSNETSRLKLKSEIVKDLIPGINWEKYEDLREDMKIAAISDDIKVPPQPPVEDPYAY